MERDGLLSKIVIVVIALAVLGTLADAAVSRRREQPAREPRVLSVRADAYAEAPPDVARISLGVTALRPTPKQAATAAGQTVSGLKAKLAQLGVGAVSVAASNLYLHAATEYSYQTGRSRHLGYKASHQLRISLKDGNIAKLSDVLDAAVSAGVTNLSGLSFEVEDDSALRAQALAEATRVVRKQAEAMAAAAGATIVGINQISDRTSKVEAGTGVTWAARKSSAEEPGVPSPMPPPTQAPDKVRVTCQVEVSFLLR